jgi:hypothetical protein
MLSVQGCPTPNLQKSPSTKSYNGTMRQLRQPAFRHLQFAVEAARGLAIDSSCRIRTIADGLEQGERDRSSNQPLL